MSSIYKKEMKILFSGMMGFIFIALMLVVVGIFMRVYNLGGAYSLSNFEYSLNGGIWAYLVVVPVLTMRAMAEETRSRTDQLLFTSPVSMAEIVLGKYLAVIALIAIALALTLPYYITVAHLGPIDHGAVVCGYIGLLLMSSAYAGIGLFASSVSNNQIISFLISLSVGLLFHIGFGILGRQMGGFAGQLALGLDMNTHFESMSRGIIDSKDIVYFASVTFAGLFAAEKTLESKIA